MAEEVDREASPTKPDSVSRTSPTLLQRLIEKDGPSWKMAHVYYGGLVYRWCRRQGCSREVAEEIAQETLARALQSLPKFEHREEQPGGFRAWLRTIASNLLVDEYRRTVQVVGTRDSSFQLQGGPVIDDSESIDEFVESLLVLIDETTAVGRTTALHFVEHVILGKQPAEIANGDPDCKPDTVYRHVVRTAKALRREFGDAKPEELMARLAEVSERKEPTLL